MARKESSKMFSRRTLIRNMLVGGVRYMGRHGDGRDNLTDHHSHRHTPTQLSLRTDLGHQLGREVSILQSVVPGILHFLHWYRIGS